MTISPRTMLHALVAGALLAVAAPAFACPSEGHGIVKEKEKEKCEDTILGAARAQAREPSARRDVAIQVEDAQGRLRTAYLGADGAIWKAGEDE